MYCSSLYKCVKAGFALSISTRQTERVAWFDWDVSLPNFVYRFLSKVLRLSLSLPPLTLCLSTASVANLLHWSTIGKTDRRMVVRCNKMGYPIRIVSPSPCGLQDVESSVCVEMRDANCNKIQRAGVVERKRQVPDTELCFAAGQEWTTIRRSWRGEKMTDQQLPLRRAESMDDHLNEL